MASATPGLDPGAKLSEILLVADTDDLRAVVKAICARYAGGVDVAWDVMADRKYGLSEKMARLHRYERCGKVFDEDANDQEACRWHRCELPRWFPIFSWNILDDGLTTTLQLDLRSRFGIQGSGPSLGTYTSAAEVITVTQWAASPTNTMQPTMAQALPRS